MSQSPAVTPHDTLYNDVYVPAFQLALAQHGYQMTPENAPRLVKMAEQLRVQHDAEVAAQQVSGGDLLSRAERKLAAYAPAAQHQPAFEIDSVVQYLLTDRPEIAEAAAQLA